MWYRPPSSCFWSQQLTVRRQSWGHCCWTATCRGSCLWSRCGCLTRRRMDSRSESTSRSQSSHQQYCITNLITVTQHVVTNIYMYHILLYSVYYAPIAISFFSQPPDWPRQESCSSPEWHWPPGGYTLCMYYEYTLLKHMYLSCRIHDSPTLVSAGEQYVDSSSEDQARLELTVLPNAGTKVSTKHVIHVCVCEISSS